MTARLTLLHAFWQQELTHAGVAGLGAFMTRRARPDCIRPRVRFAATQVALSTRPQGHPAPLRVMPSDLSAQGYRLIAARITQTRAGDLPTWPAATPIVSAFAPFGTKTGG